MAVRNDVPIDVVATTEPLELVERSADVTPIIARFVVVAAVVVVLLKSAFTKCEVDDAKIPACAQIGDDVAAESKE